MAEQRKRAGQVKPLPALTPQQRRDFWIYYKCKQNLWTVRDARDRYPDFAKAYDAWKANTLDKEKFLEVARKYVPTPNM